MSDRVFTEALPGGVFLKRKETDRLPLTYPRARKGPFVLLGEGRPIMTS
jgi:hypothetical protein